MNKLTASAVNAAKARQRAYTLADGGGLVLLIKPDGGRFWRFRYRYNGIAKMLSMGTFPDTGLGLAREKLGDARKLLAAGIDPSAKRKAEKRAVAGDSFKAVAEEFLASQRKPTSQTIATARRRLEKYIYPRIGRTTVAAVTAPDLLDALRVVEKRGAHETAHRLRALCGRVLRYAIATGRAERDVSADLQGALGSTKQRHFAAITDPSEFGSMLAAIEKYDGQVVTRLALQLLALTFVRPGELRLADWSEFDLDSDMPQWTVPANRTKLRREHIVPLASQTVSLLRELQQHRRDDGQDHAFPSMRRGRAISEGTMNVALRSLGYDGTRHVPHGFRSSASTLLHARGFNHDVIEQQLAHKRPGVAGVYNRAHLLPERRVMMQAWADYLDELVLVG